MADFSYLDKADAIQARKVARDARAEAKANKPAKKRKRGPNVQGESYHCEGSSCRGKEISATGFLAVRTKTDSGASGIVMAPVCSNCGTKASVKAAENLNSDNAKILPFNAQTKSLYDIHVSAPEDINRDEDDLPENPDKRSTALDRRLDNAKRNKALQSMEAITNSTSYSGSKQTPVLVVPRPNIPRENPKSKNQFSISDLGGPGSTEVSYSDPDNDTNYGLELHESNSTVPKPEVATTYYQKNNPDKLGRVETKPITVAEGNVDLSHYLASKDDNPQGGKPDLLFSGAASVTGSKGTGVGKYNQNVVDAYTRRHQEVLKQRRTPEERSAILRDALLTAHHDPAQLERPEGYEESLTDAREELASKSAAVEGDAFWRQLPSPHKTWGEIQQAKTTNASRKLAPVPVDSEDRFNRDAVYHCERCNKTVTQQGVKKHEAFHDKMDIAYLEKHGTPKEAPKNIGISENATPVVGISDVLTSQKAARDSRFDALARESQQNVKQKALTEKSRIDTHNATVEPHKAISYPSWIGPHIS